MAVWLPLIEIMTTKFTYLFQELPENILASNETEPILSDSSVDLSLNSSCGRIDRRIPGDMLYSSYMRS